MNGIEGVIYLCKCAVNGETPDHAAAAQLDPDALFRAASRHMLCAMVGIMLQAAGVDAPAFRQAVAAAKRKTVVLRSEQAAVARQLDAAGIWYLPLKGAVLREWYPAFGMRESADLDILFDRTREADVRAAMLALGYEVKSYGHGHHDVYYKKPLTNLQMHVELFGPGYPAALNAYYADVKARLVPKGGCEFAFTPEDFYLYVLAHACDHFEKAGTGLRTVLDTYVMLRRLQPDLAYIRAESAKLGMEAFEAQLRSLALHLFGDGALTAADREMLGRITAAGAYGTLETAVAQQVAAGGGGRKGKAKYLLRRLFLPMELVQAGYPLFYRHRLLLPLLPLYRLIRGLRRRRKRLTAEWKIFFKA